MPADQNNSNARQTHFVLYDDACPFCTFQMRVVSWLDWFNTVSLLPLSHPRAAEIAPTLTREALLEAIHGVTPAGRIYRGARCLRFIGMRMPLAMPLALVLWVPGVIWIAEQVYQWVSRHRYLLSRLFGCQAACAVMPLRRRANEEQARVK
jgi:predicted DCC family thiol-disulfide oxidoreductase YuxK